MSRFHSTGSFVRQRRTQDDLGLVNKLDQHEIVPLTHCGCRSFVDPNHTRKGLSMRETQIGGCNFSSATLWSNDSAPEFHSGTREREIRTRRFPSAPLRKYSSTFGFSPATFLDP